MIDGKDQEVPQVVLQVGPGCRYVYVCVYLYEMDSHRCKENKKEMRVLETAE